MAFVPTRLARIRAAMASQHVDVLYLRGLSNIAWATGFEKVFDTEAAHALIITQTRTLIHSDMRYSEALRREAQGTEIEVDDRRASHAAILSEVVELVISARAQGTQAGEHAAAHAGESDAISLGIETSMPLSEFRALERQFASRLSDGTVALTELSGFIEKLREVKDDAEIALMKRAQSITDSAFARLLDFMAAGMTEREVQLQLDQFMFEEGAEGLAFDTIVATGAHASSPHAIPGDTRLAPGDAVVMDFGARFGGYCSDMTRTVFVGEPSDELKGAFATLQHINETCEAALHEGACAADVHNLAEDLLAQAGYAGKMGHSLGHSVGLDIHEAPTLSPSNKAELVAGNVVTVEPGIYIPGSFGMRLEDFGVVTRGGFDVFTKSSHKMFIIDKLG